MPSFSEAVTNVRMVYIDEYIINKTSLIQIRTSSAWNSNCITYRCVRARLCFDFSLYSSGLNCSRKIGSYYLGVFFSSSSEQDQSARTDRSLLSVRVSYWSRSEVARRIPLAQLVNRDDVDTYRRGSLNNRNS
uniref:Uncharacterized protein n=1 Tax=Trichogramma kaykai TaxID=54128 RepID=A0ABD2W1M2_9HYME